MNENDFYDELKKQALDSDNYKKWRKEHTKVFGKLFSDAFSESEEAQICFTAALISISQRQFDKAMPKLDMLEGMIANECDEAAIYYFKGLNHEMLGNSELMEEYYEKLGCLSSVPRFVLAFHPYYRTAKFAQRDSECSKSMYYYRKALDFYRDVELDAHTASVASHIIYDIATLCLYMHEYDQCEHFLEFSYKYDKSKNAQRDYVKAILLALQGKKEDCDNILNGLNLFLRENCQAMTEAIFNGTDLHYCAVVQERKQYKAFWTSFLNDANEFSQAAFDGNVAETEKNISLMLTRVFGFMKRQLECRIETVGETVVVKCKNYRVKTLIAEHKELFAMMPKELSGFAFFSVEEFECF